MSPKSVILRDGEDDASGQGPSFTLREAPSQPQLLEIPKSTISAYSQGMAQ